jgi:catechol 2,3-dioxygenase-like lactoylglutathione lyase family enzyme
VKVAVHHVALDVDDLDAALRFYVDGMGFTELRRPDFGVPGAWLDMGDHQLHLVEVPGPMPANGGAHFALRVDDLDDSVAALRARGITVHPIPEIPGAGRQAFLNDPAGNLIELNEPTGPVP